MADAAAFDIHMDIRTVASMKPSMILKRRTAFGDLLYRTYIGTSEYACIES